VAHAEKTGTTLNIAMLGASGRMGRSIIPLIAGDSDGLR
jgi:dihydrodipicolinate reductase